ncbi:MAG TPA: carboxypeptidase regulatory-like domain-containing protein, partial [Candidatus Angelobacter sp.]|nr:carboxypeptidase regulatory-like domain-containing protein [Candidatus Angelobacter sp.]
TAAGSISGVVKNAQNCAPMPGVTMASKSGTAITDSNGNYSIPASARNSVAITATRTGWLSNARAATSTLNAVAEPSPSKIWMSTAGIVTGFVFDSAGIPIAGATVTLNGGEPHQTKTLTTGSNGAYSSNWIAVGAYNMTASAANHTGTTASTTVNTGLTTSLNFNLQ